MSQKKCASCGLVNGRRKLCQACFADLDAVIMAIEQKQAQSETLEDDSEELEEVNDRVVPPTITLNDGVEIPQIGFGTFSISHSLRKTDETVAFKNAVVHAIRSGYRHIDSAEFYRTHKVIGEAMSELIADGVIQREDLFITSKVDNSVRTTKAVRKSVHQTLRDLRTDYVDLYLIHSPQTIHSKSSGRRGSDVLEVYGELLELQKQGKIRSVGVSNFGVPHLEAIRRAGLRTPSVNQIEVHCFLYQEEVIEYCEGRNICVEAYCPLAKANKRAKKNGMLQKVVRDIGNGKNWAHIMLRYLIQRGFVPLPKSVHSDRIEANLDLLDFEIGPRNMRILDRLCDVNMRVSWNILNTEQWDL